MCQVLLCSEEDKAKIAGLTTNTSVSFSLSLLGIAETNQSEELGLSSTPYLTRLVD
jgi:hypothetical protein